jgi:hypothetical protein
VTVKPDTLVLTFGASGKAEKAEDAVTKLKSKSEAIRQALKQVLDEKKAANARVEDTGVAFGAAGGGAAGQVIFVGGMGGDENGGASETTASTQLKVTVPNIDTLASEDVSALVSAVMDKATDAGAESGAPNCGTNVWIGRGQPGGAGVSFTISDPDAQKDKAFEEAVAKARARAEKIASKLGCEVGGAVRVKDLSDGEDVKKNPAMAWVAYLAEDGGTAVSTSGSTELTVELEVAFELKAKK